MMAACTCKFENIYLQDAIPSAEDLVTDLLNAMCYIIDEVCHRSKHYDSLSATCATTEDDFNDESDIEVEDSTLSQSAMMAELLQLGFAVNDIPSSFRGKDPYKNSTKRNKKRKLITADTISTNGHLDNFKLSTTSNDNMDFHDRYSMRYKANPNCELIDGKYWDQRYRLVSRYDHGIWLDPESWYSITPEIIADHITLHCQQSAKIHNKQLRTALDGFCGCGGNSISLAQAFASVLAIDYDPVKTTYLEHNAAIYGMTSKIRLLCRDIYSVLDRLESPFGRRDPSELCTRLPARPLKITDASSEDISSLSMRSKPVIIKKSSQVTIDNIYNDTTSPIDIIFLAPPWGGPEYTQCASYDLRTMIPSGDGFELVAAAAKVTEHIVLMIPKNTSHKHLRKLQRYVGLPALVHEVHLHGKHKMTVVYFGSILAGQPAEVDVPIT